MRREDPTQEEQKAIRALRAGDWAGLKVLVEGHQLLAVRLAYLILGDRSAAEDVVQTAFVKAAARISQFDSTKPFKPWFLKIVTNDALKVRAADGWLADEEEWVGPSPSAEDEVVRYEDREALRTAIAQLTPLQRGALVLRHYLDHSDAEIATALGCSLSAAKWHLHAARQRLRERLAAQRQGDSAFKDRGEADHER